MLDPPTSKMSQPQAQAEACLARDDAREHGPEYEETSRRSGAIRESHDGGLRCSRLNEIPWERESQVRQKSVALRV
jgi:hypothetical protein